MFGGFTKDLGIDLGTANTLVYVRGKGIAVREPSVVALRTDTKTIEAVGEQAKKNDWQNAGQYPCCQADEGRRNCDFETTSTMIKYFIRQAQKQRSLFPRHPNVMVCVPSGITAVEKRAVEDATKQAGAREAYTIEDRSRRQLVPISRYGSRQAAWWWTSAAVQRKLPLFRLAVS